jgi:hypothetical protein
LDFLPFQGGLSPPSPLLIIPFFKSPVTNLRFSTLSAFPDPNLTPSHIRTCALVQNSLALRPFRLYIMFKSRRSLWNPFLSPFHGERKGQGLDRGLPR